MVPDGAPLVISIGTGPQTSMHPTENSRVFLCMSDHDPNAVHRDMERIFENFDRARHWQTAETSIGRTEHPSKPLATVGRKIARIAPLIVASSFVATLGYGIAAHMAGRHLAPAEYSSRDMATVAEVSPQKPPAADFAVLMDMRGSKANYAKSPRTEQRHHHQIDYDDPDIPVVAPRQVKSGETAAEKLRREYEEDAAITRRLNKEAFEAVVRAPPPSRSPAAVSTPSGNG